MGNLDAVRDWGYAPEYVEAHVADAAARRADDYVVATGTAYTRRATSCSSASSTSGSTGRSTCSFDERYLRPTEVDALIGGAAKAEELLGWMPKVLTPELARIMVDADIAALEAGGTPWIDRVTFA